MLVLDECLAKTVTKTDGSVAPGLNVLTHCVIAGQVARELLNRLPDWLVQDLFPPGSELLAAVHDVGKVNPSFQEKLTRAISREHLPASRLRPLGNPDLDVDMKGHATVSHAVLAAKGKYYAEVVGRHHGTTPPSVAEVNAPIYGGPAWQRLRENLLQRVQETLNIQWPVIRDVRQADALTGLTCVADWIASGSAFDHADLNDPELSRIVQSAVDLAGFIPPRLVTDLSFGDVFSGFTPLPAQSAFIAATTGPGVYVLEAPMGMGKTEAALYAAYKVLEQGQATGIYFALPTQLTSDKIYDRMNQFLSAILSPDCIHRRSLLLHGSAWLKETAFGQEGNPGKSWFDSRKRGLLAPFAVGTIDQALMAVMNVRHGFVRAFGLAGKVVILDEVHSYDAYTGTIMEELVHALRGMQCTVIVLSATLTAERRSKLLATPQAGVRSDYPLISARPHGQALQEIPVTQESTLTVELALHQHDAPAIEAALERAEQGQQVLWIENTVSEAQSIFQRLSARAHSFADYGLLHSRFLKVHRWEQEDRWVELYGKNGGPKRQERGRILVGTQVLEQSLDIDADFLVSRLAPMDLLFQRLGRLWRHRANDPLRPPTATQPAAWVLSPTLEAALEDEEAFGKTHHVYAPYVLCRTLEVLQQWGGKRLILPTAIRPQLEAVYADRAEKGAWATYLRELENRRATLRRLALHGVARQGVTASDENVGTRYSEIDSCEVLLIRALDTRPAGVVIRLLDDTRLELSMSPIPRQARAWRETAIQLKQNTVMVAKYLAPETPTSQIGWLKNHVWIGTGNTGNFRVALVQPSGELIGLDAEPPHEKYRLFYTRETGYTSRQMTT